MQKILVLIVILMGLSNSFSSDSAELGLKTSKQYQQNLMQMTQYSWKLRSEVLKEDASKSVKLYQIRYDIDGKRQKTELSDQKKTKKVRGVVRKRVAKRKKGEAKDFAKEVIEVIQVYSYPSTGQFVDLFEKGSITNAEEPGTLNIRSENVFNQGDTVSLFIDQSNNNLKNMTFQTTVDGRPIEGQIEYRTHGDEFVYPARTTVTVRSKSIKIVIENFDFIRQ